MSYKVFLDDNFHFMEESERYELGEFPTLDTAVAVAKQILDKYLVATYELGMSSTVLFDSYTSFGNYPFLRAATGNAGEVLFSAWKYAERRCNEICKASATAVATARKGSVSKPKKAKNGLDNRQV